MSDGYLQDVENCFAAGWSDGLPVIPPYGSLVEAMLAALGWEATEVVGAIPSQSIEIRAEQLAATAVMAGCETRYGPLLRALSEALVDPRFNLSGVEVTTGGVAALVIVGGPIVKELGFAHEANALGANARPNATIGRFAQMVRLFCGRGGGALQPHGTVGHPGRIGFLIAEHPETLWPSFHTQLGHAPGVSAISVMAAEGPNSVNNHFASTGAAVLETIADCIAHSGTTNFYYRHGAYVVALAPDHAELVTSDFSRDDARAFLMEKAVRATDELVRLGRIPEVPRADLDVVAGTMRVPVRDPGRIHFIETGAPGGKFSAVVPAWAGSRHDVSREIPTS
ncbi:hypothetical protein [Phytohabitans suffuscus]|uniref:Uncharacterized protein n=1 Tax=Phytohabitans suffuscus TaxID=624315 RepID=A0A6F8YCB5_9ACTN|nr:hypothetical protein [Phytohabitans suffuscus]BCB83774.1 hypothetical protein Psuf_010870 [Phytohabitans suffuscus]